MNTYGASFSIKYCNELSLDWRETLLVAINDLGIKRLRLMSYWDIIEPTEGVFDFNDLDEQIFICEKYGVAVTLCVGLRQPRYPECHLPEWLNTCGGDRLRDAVLKFNNVVVGRYKDRNCIISWQLENEALNHGIGTCTNFNRDRLRAEYAALKHLDESRPIIMSTSNSVGLPIIGPIPDIVGFSVYRSQYDGDKQKYSFSKMPAWLYGLRKGLITVFLRKNVIIHELQCEPWGPTATVNLADSEQSKSMNPDILKNTVEYAIKTDCEYIDMWGLEWWYWRKFSRNDDSMWESVRRIINS